MKGHKVCILVRQMGLGGAQRQLLEFVRALAPDIRPIVISFYDGGVFAREMEALLGSKWIVLDKRGRWDSFSFLIRLTRLIRRERPAVLYAYAGMTHLFSIWIRVFMRRMRIVWAIRDSSPANSRSGSIDQVLFRVECQLSRHVDLIIANSLMGREVYAMHGFPRSRIRVIPNGIDVSRFRPNAIERMRVRSEWGVSSDETLIGYVGRIHPIKDIPNFIRAASLVAPNNPKWRFVIVGTGSPDLRESLQQLAQDLGIGSRIIWAGARDEMPAVYASLDLLTSCSHAEGFSNSIAEAMASGVRCVVTSVGDSEYIVGDTGVIIPTRDPGALSVAWGQVLQDMDKYSDPRKRIESEFSVERMTGRTWNALMDTLEDRND